MGLFSKLKGGVKVKLEAPQAVPSNQVIPVKVTVTADKAAVIKSVSAQIRAQAREQGVNFGGNQNGMGGVGVQSGTTNEFTVAQAENREEFNLAGGETKTVEFQLYLNGGAAGGGGSQLGSNAGGALGGVLKAVGAVVNNLDHVNYMYTVHASADIDGHALNANDHQSIQILPPDSK